ERSVIRTAESPASRHDRADDTGILERREYVAQNAGGFRRSKNRRTTHAPRARIDIEVSAKLFVTRLWFFKRSEVFLHVSFRPQQAFLFAAPQRDPNRATRLYAECLQDARRFHHDRATDRVVSRARGGVPGIKMTAKHD